MSKKDKQLNLKLAKLIFSLLCWLGIVSFFISGFSVSSWSKDEQIDTPAKIRELKHRDAGTRARAADQLGRNRKKEAGADLLASLKKEKDETVKLHLIASLAEIGEQSALPVLMDLAQNDKAENVRTITCLYLGKFNQPEVIQLLKNVLLNEEEKSAVRIHAATALSLYCDQSGVREAMEIILRSDSYDVKYGLVNCLRLVKNKPEGTVLLNIARKDQNEKIRALAERILK